MNLYLLIPLLSGTACTALAMWIFALAPDAVPNRRAALLVSGAAFWALCEVAWNTAPDPEVALRLVKLSSLGWVAIGPLGLEVLHEISGARSPAVRRALPRLYAAAGAFLALDLATPWIHPGVVATPWGWGYRLGPLYVLFYPFTVGCLLVGLRVAWRSLRGTASPAERTQLGWVMLGVAVPLVVASTTDGLLPLAGVQVVHLATGSFVFLAATVAWSFHRYGHSLLAPSAFAREILETLPDGVALVHPDGRIRSANPGLARLLGEPPEALETLTLGDLVRGVDVGAALEGESEECELRTRRGAVPVAIAWRPLRDKRGLSFGQVVAVRDLRELVELRRRLVTSGRLAAVGELAAGIAHEINNPIAFVGSNLGTLREYWAELAKRSDATDEWVREGEELIEEALEGVQRVSGIVRDVGGLARPDREGDADVDVNAAVDAALRLVRPRLEPGTRVERCLGDVPPVRGCARRLQQVLLNLLVNAAQAVGEGGVIRVLSIRTDGGVEVRVHDDGRGIPEEIQERLFDPFFTTKTPGEGMGLGLAISYQIVREHGGELRIESAPGAGTTAVVRLPQEGPTEVGAQKSERPDR